MQKQNVEQVFSIWILVAKFLSCVDASHLLICNKLLTSLLSGTLVKWFITNRNNFGIDYSQPKFFIRIPFVIENKVIFCYIDYMLNSVYTFMCFSDSDCLSDFHTKLNITSNTRYFIGRNHEKFRYKIFLEYVKKIDLRLWEILKISP
jgi:hypothetical protein